MSRHAQARTPSPAAPVGHDGPPLSAWHLVLPSSGAFTGLTAAGLHGLWLPPLPADSLLRLLHTVCDVPVEAQHEVFHDGRFVARGDLWLLRPREVLSLIHI